MKNALSLAILSSTIFCSGVVHADFAVKAPDQGTVTITVFDENGVVVPDAPVYIYGAKRSKFIGGSDVKGGTTFAMKGGEYRISSAMVKKTGDYVDRFASNEAFVKVVNGDAVSLVLTLRPIQDPEQMAQSYATLHVAGIPGSLLTN